MNRNTIISIVIWAIIAGALFLFFNARSVSVGFPGIVLLVPAIAIVLYYIVRQGTREQSSSNLAFRRFEPKAVMIVGVVLLVTAVVWTAFVAKAVQNDADQVLLLVVIPVLAMIALASILISTGIYYLIKRT